MGHHWRDVVRRRDRCVLRRVDLVYARVGRGGADFAGEDGKGLGLLEVKVEGRGLAVTRRIKTKYGWEYGLERKGKEVWMRGCEGTESIALVSRAAPATVKEPSYEILGGGRDEPEGRPCPSYTTDDHACTSHALVP